MRKMYFLSLLSFLLGLGAMAQTTQQIVVGNGGIYNDDSDHVTITGIDPDDYTSSTIGEVIRESIQDLIVVDNIAFVAAEDSLVKFDLENNTKLAAVYQPNLSRLFAAEEVLYVSLRSDLNGPPADGVYLRAFDFELNELYETTEISMDAAGMCKVEDSLYVAVPGDWQATEGHFAVVSLDFNYVREENWGTDAVGIYDLMADGNTIYTVNKSPYGATNGSISTYHTQSTEFTTNVIPHIVGKGVAIMDNLLYLGLDYGIGSYNINNNQVVESQIVQDPGSANYISIAAAVLDPVNEKFYVTITDYFSMGQGFVYDLSGEELGNFDAMVSAEAMAIQYDVGSFINEFNNMDVQVYPNPFVNQIQIDMDQQIEEISIFNLNGQLVKNILATNSKIYNLSELKTGSYLLKIRTKDGFTVQKLVKE